MLNQPPPLRNGRKGRFVAVQKPPVWEGTGRALAIAFEPVRELPADFGEWIGRLDRVSC